MHCPESPRSRNRVRIWDYTWIIATSELHQPGGGVEIGDDTYIGPHGYLGAGGGISIGRGVLVGAYVQFLAEKTDKASG